jgi:hypothetical protein
MKRLVSVLYLIAAAGNLLPALGAISAARLEALYRVPIADANLAVLMRHRAVLLGIVGALLAGAAFRPAWRPIALAAGFASMVSFIALAAAGGDLNPAVRRVAVLDLGLIAALVGAAVIGAGGARAR